MSANLLYAGSFVAGLAFAIAVTPFVALLARRLNLLDLPGGRRKHPRPIPRPGGLAVFVAFGLSIALFWTIDQLAGAPTTIPQDVRSPSFRLVILAAIIGVVVGFVDDLLDLRARWQLLGQLVVASVIVYAGIRIEFVNDPFDPSGVFLLGALDLPITILWVVGMINAINFIDGLDGLATGVSAIASVVLGFIALQPSVNEPFVAWIQFALAGALLGFLVFNVHPARLFLGTTGVTFIGTMFAALTIFGTEKVAAGLLVLGVPIIDTFYVIVRRVLEGRPPFAPDRGHFHHRLLDVGLSHTAAVFLIYVITAALGAVALVASGSAQLLAFAAVFVAFGVVVVVLAQRSAKAQEYEPDLYRNDGGQA